MFKFQINVILSVELDRTPHVVPKPTTKYTMQLKCMLTIAVIAEKNTHAHKLNMHIEYT